MTIFRRFTPAVLLLLGSAAHAQGFEDLAALERRVTSSLGAGVGEPGGPAQGIDRRLKLAPCPAPAVVEPPVLGAVTIRCQPLGWRVRVPLVRSAAATAETAPKSDPLIRKGDQVELIASSGSFTVSTLAVAQQDGATGERVRVRADGKAGTVIGVVTADGRVSLSGFK